MNRRTSLLLRRPGAAWAALAALLGLGALAGAVLAGWHGSGAAAEALAWRRDAPQEAWRLWSAAFVHFDARHLIHNTAGALLVGAIGAAVALPGRAALAWALAWPLTHAALWLAAGLEGYAGLSGVLHAGAAVAVVFGVVEGRGLQRRIGAALGFALLTKLAQERAWVEPLQAQAGWDVPLAVVAHAGGALCGALAAGLLLALRPSAEGGPPQA